MGVVPRKILKRYVTHSGIFVDVLSTWVAVLPWSRAFQLLQLLRLVHVQSLLQMIEEMYVPTQFHGSVSLGKTCGLFGLMCHWSACVWGAIGGGSVSSLVILDHGVNRSGDGWIQRQGLVDEGALIQYMTSLNFATGLMTGGETYMSPAHLSELLYTTCMLFASFFICSTLLSQIIVTVSKLSEGHMRFNENLRSVVSFMSNRKVPTTLQRKVRRYLDFRFGYRARCVGVGQATFIQDLSPWLQLELTRHLFGELICNHPYFKAMPAQALSHVCLSVAATLFSAGEVVVERGKTSEFVVFVAMGRLAALTRNATKSKSLSRRGFIEIAQFRMALDVDGCDEELTPQSFPDNRDTQESSIRSLAPVDQHVTAEFGEEVIETFEKGMWFDDICLFKDVVRIQTIISLADSELILISTAALLCLRERFPELAAYHTDVTTVICEGGLLKAGFLCSVCSRAGHCEKDCPKADP